MSPYRTTPPAEADVTLAERACVPHEEWLAAAALALLGTLRVLVAIVQGERFGTEVTIAALVGGVGAVLLGQLALRTVCAHRL